MNPDPDPGTDLPLPNAISEFIADLQLAGRARWTIKKHDLELQRLGRWCTEQGYNWQTLTRKELQGYTRLRADKGFSSRSNMFCTLRTFYRWAVQEGYVALSPASGFKTPSKPKPLPRSLNRDQVARLVKHLAEQDGRRAHRDEAMLLTGLYAGLRACELAGLCWPAVDFKAGVISIELSKMGRGRAVPLHPALRTVLEKWRAEQALDDPDAPVFSLDGEAFKPTRVGKVARKTSQECGIHFTAHMLRHTYATWALRGSGNLYAVSKALGHSQLAQTEIYVSCDVEDLRPALDTLPDLKSW